MSLSAPQIALLRTEKQRSIPGLAIHQPATVLAAQITDYTGTDQIIEFDFGSVTEGSYEDVLPGQLVFIGSVAGAYDLGIVRVRKAWTSTTAYVGEESNIAYANGLYITVIDAMDIRPKHLVVSADSVLMDGDVEYSDQHTDFDPVPILGGHAVLDVESYPATITFPDVADTWVFDSTISDYLMTATAGVVTDETTTNPTLTISSYPTNGYIRVALLATAANGKSFTGYRYIFVFDADHRPITDFVLDSCSCDRESGGWSASVVLNEASDIALVRAGEKFPGSLAVIFSKDYFDGSEDVVGLYAGRENVWMSGWVYQKSSVNDPEFQPNAFDIEGPAFWMQKMSAYPTGIEISASAATAWTQCAGLTVDKGLFHYLHWRSTATQVLDVYLTDNTLYTAAVEAAASNMWGQISDIAYSQILAEPACNHNGKLVIRVPYNLIPSGDRSGASTLVMALAGQDFSRSVEITTETPTVSQVLLSGVAVDVYGNGTPLFSLAPGHVPGLIGDPFPVSNLLLGDQTQSNILAGLVMAASNNPYNAIPLTLNGTNRAFDIAPPLHATLSDIDEYTGVVIPYSISYSHDSRTGKTEVEVDFEGETDENDTLYINGDIPDGNGGFVDIAGLGKLPPLDPLGVLGLNLPIIPGTVFPPTIPTLVETDCGDNLTNYYNLVFDQPFLNGADSDLLVAKALFPCVLRAGGVGPSYIELIGDFRSDAVLNVNVYGVLNGSRIVTANLSEGKGLYHITAVFNVLSNTEIDSIEIELDSGAGPVNGIWYVATGGVVASGTVQANSEAGADETTVAGKSYAFEGSGGPWKPGPAFPNNWYNYRVDTLGSYGNANGSFALTLEGLVVYAEAIDSNYARAYFVADDTDINFQVADSPGSFGDNSGSLGYTLRNATIYGRTMQIQSAIINNVCAP